MSQPLHYLSTLTFSDAWLAELRERAPYVRVEQITVTSPAEIPQETWGDIHVLHTSVVFPPAACVPALRLVQLDTSGADHVADTELWKTGAIFCSIGGVSAVPLSEYVIFMILGFAHRLPQMLAVRDTRLWPLPTERWERFLPATVAGRTVGIIGYGRIGREIARSARALGLTPLGVSRTGTPPAPTAPEARSWGRAASHDPTPVVAVTELNSVLARSDYVVVVTPLTEDTRGLMGPAAIAAIKPGAIVINAARGGIVDESALLAALRQGRLGGAALDVFEDEPLAPTSHWWNEPNVVVTPHISGLAPHYADQVMDLLCDNLDRLHRGHSLVNVIDPARGY